LQSQVREQKREVDLWYADAMQGKRENQGWTHLLDPVFAQGFLQLQPPRTIVQYQTNTGALECFDAVFSACETGQAGSAFDPTSREDVTAFNDLAGQMANRLESRAKQAWEISSDLKHTSDISDLTKAFRFPRKANRYAGFSSQCQDVAGFLKRAIMPVAEPKTSLPAPSTPDGSGACAQTLRDLPNFCVLPPGNGEEDLHYDCCGF